MYVLYCNVSIKPMTDMLVSKTIPIHFIVVSMFHSSTGKRLTGLEKSSLPLVRKQERRDCLFAFVTQAALIVGRRIFYPTVFRYRRMFDDNFYGFYVVATFIEAICE